MADLTIENSRALDAHKYLKKSGGIMVYKEDNKNICKIESVESNVKTKNGLRRLGLKVDCFDSKTKKLKRTFQAIDAAGGGLDGKIDPDKEVVLNSTGKDADALYKNAVNKVNEVARKKAEQKRIVDAMIAAGK